MARRDTGEKEGVSRDLFVSEMTKRLELMQADMLERAKAFRKVHSKEIDSMEDFKSFFTMQDEEYPELQGGFAWSHWCDGAACEEKISSELAVTIRLIPFDRDANGSGACVVCGGASVGRVVFAKSY
jgi:prolyl-tRNA synthetase